MEKPSLFVSLMLMRDIFYSLQEKELKGKEWNVKYVLGNNTQNTVIEAETYQEALKETKEYIKNRTNKGQSSRIISIKPREVE